MCSSTGATRSPRPRSHSSASPTGCGSSAERVLPLLQQNPAGDSDRATEGPEPPSQGTAAQRLPHIPPLLILIPLYLRTSLSLEQPLLSWQRAAVAGGGGHSTAWHPRLLREGLEGCRTPQLLRPDPDDEATSPTKPSSEFSRPRTSDHYPSASPTTCPALAQHRPLGFSLQWSSLTVWGARGGTGGGQTDICGHVPAMRLP